MIINCLLQHARLIECPLTLHFPAILGQFAISLLASFQRTLPSHPGQSHSYSAYVFSKLPPLPALLKDHYTARLERRAPKPHLLPHPIDISPPVNSPALAS
ncbi:hypothetical protein PGT21_031671 [Puccinia graminis f. sp. tritici]|uniref:Uncharacterized protein n=1 Tax=Puccinia graminis f. sp. tritici TaxID=56615 RepID=A0A5B0PF37_PUCGR|nr:hypothetical protein PGT21_031671 [Puccinia graminis f. sp. tritici]